MAVKSFNVMNLGRAGIFDPKEMGYRDSLDIIKDESVKIQKSFVKIGWYLKHIRDNELYTEDGYTNVYECAADQLGYSQSTVSRFINICEKFSKDRNSPELDEKYAGFDKSQMIEMLPMEEEHLEKVSPEMTVKQIREIKHEVTEGPDDESIRLFCCKCLWELSENEINDLEKYMKQHYGQGYPSGGDSEFWYDCSPRGIKINKSGEITWHQFVKRVHELEKRKPGSCFNVNVKEAATVKKQADNDIPGQTTLEEDFPEYLPDECDAADPEPLVLQEESYATSHKEPEEDDSGEGAEMMESSVDSGTAKEMVVFPWKTVQPEMPRLKNDKQRKEWLGNYTDWGLWYRDVNIDVNYYKFDFDDGSRLIVAEYPQRHSYYGNNEEDEHFYHLLEKNKKGYNSAYDEKYRHQTDPETYLVEFLKNLQKRHRRG